MLFKKKNKEKKTPRRSIYSPRYPIEAKLSGGKVFYALSFRQSFGGAGQIDYVIDIFETRDDAESARLKEKEKDNEDRK